MGKYRKTTGKPKPWENHGKTENHGENQGENGGNHGKTMGKPMTFLWFGPFWDILGPIRDLPGLSSLGGPAGLSNGPGAPRCQEELRISKRWCASAWNRFEIDWDYWVYTYSIIFTLYYVSLRVFQWVDRHFRGHFPDVSRTMELRLAAGNSTSCTSYSVGFISWWTFCNSIYNACCCGINTYTYIQYNLRIYIYMYECMRIYTYIYKYVWTYVHDIINIHLEIQMIRRVITMCV